MFTKASKPLKQSMLNKIMFNSVANNFHQHEVVFYLYNDRLVREISISNI